MMMQKIGKKVFRYNAEKCLVEWVEKATPDMYADDKEWMEKYGRPMWGIDKDGYIVLDSVGLSRAHWENKEDRTMYLTEWCDDIDEEVSCLVDDFIKYELPAYQ